MSSPEAAAAALTMLSSMGPARLVGLLAEHDPCRVWSQIVAGETAAELAKLARVRREVVDGWSAQARSIDLESVARSHNEAGVSVIWRGDALYPRELDSDIEPPAVLFSQGDFGEVVDKPRVAVVGTRSCTRYGVEVARELGLCLAAAGVVVVSGLALGIDAAAHAGALAAGTAPLLGVVGSGLDVVYPRANSGLWEHVRRHGWLISEAPIGAGPERWRFPARNRVIAALSDIVVVVESHERGGSLSTVDEALERGVPVMSVPGSVHSSASRGTNQLIADGSAPVCSVEDVLEALELTSGAAPSARLDQSDAHVHPDVLAEIGAEPVSFESLVERTGIDPGALALALEELAGAGAIERTGFFYERRTPPPDSGRRAGGR